MNMVKIRLQRVGKSKMASYRLVATPSTVGAKKNGILEILGNYNPYSKKGAFKAERINYWLKNGAKLSETANNLLINHKVIQGEKMAVRPRSAGKPKAEAKPSQGSAKPEAAPAPAA